MKIELAVQLLSVVLGAVIGGILGFWSTSRQTIFERRINHVERFLELAYELVGDLVKVEAIDEEELRDSEIGQRKAKLSTYGTLATLYLSEDASKKVEEYTSTYQKALTDRMDPSIGPGDEDYTGFRDVSDELNDLNGTLESEVRQGRDRWWCRVLAKVSCA